MMTSPLTLRTINEVHAHLDGWRARHGSIGFVPTMGALHAGHLSLVDAARRQNDYVVVSIFVNPTQFGPNEDFAAYPRQVDRDMALLETRNVDAVFLPEAREIYPGGYATTVSVAGLPDVLCGAHRPGHFDGVCTVVSKLLNIVQPDAAYFGEKDYQQQLIIRRMVKDLNMRSRIEPVATMREKDGLAMSSRNQYLSPAERKAAPLLHETLQWVRAELQQDSTPIPELLNEAQNKLDYAGFIVEYLEIRDRETLALVEESYHIGGSRLFVAARLGKTRLIDNIALET